MEVYYGKTKRPIVFGVGGVIVAMVTTVFVKYLLAAYRSEFFSDFFQIWHEGALW